jgi:DNA repair protein RadC
MKDKLPHEGHRERLKNRFLSSGLDNFEAHNILELLLFYSIPRQDTNEIAHSLIERFGSLKGVFDADFSELIKVCGIKENSATLIKLIPQLARAYMNDETVDESQIFDHADKIGEYFIKKFIGEANEVVYIMLLDNSWKLIKCEKLFEGSINSSLVDMRKIAETVLLNKASSMIIAHNHPNGLPVPSEEDLQTTGIFTTLFPTLGVNFLEHFIIASNQYVPIIHKSKIFHSNDNKLKLKYH